jgi:pimeloyl-ACP methyl ester carboxylesterase
LPLVLNWIWLAIGCFAAATGIWNLASASSGLTVTQTLAGATPVTLFSVPGETPRPVVIIAHGFAGSQQLMQPFAITLARAGYLAVSYDLLGHGRNPLPLTGDITRAEGATANLVAELGRVADLALALPQSDGRLAVLGHSMASDIVVRFALSDPRVAATIAVSMFSPVVTATTPKNLLVIVGAWEPGLRAEALRAVGLASPSGTAEEGITYGDPAAGTGRRAVFADSVEHVGVLYSAESLREARDWLDSVWGRAQTGEIEARGLSIVLLFLGVFLIARFAAGHLPRVVDGYAGSGHRWRRLLLIGVAPALLTPLLLWKAPVDFLPVPVGDYLAVHFLVYGLITALALWIFRADARRPVAGAISWRNMALGIVVATVFCLAALYLPIDLFVTSFVPTGPRLPLIVAMTLGLLPWFLADEWLTRGATSPRGAYIFTKLCFLVSLAIAIAINLEELFFLIIIVPVILVFFTLFGLLSSWIYRRAGHPAVGAVTNALLFGWAIAVTFPFLGG